MLYDIYVSEQDLLPQIDGFEDAEYMAFDSWEDARRYVTSTANDGTNNADL